MSNLENVGQVKRLHFVSFGEEEKPAVPAAVLVKEEKPDPIVIAPVVAHISEKELEAAKTKAYEEGKQEGLQAAQEKFDKDTVAREESMRSLMEVIANRITIAAETHKDFLKSQQNLLSKLTLTIAKKLAGEALKREPYANVEALLRECMGMITGAPKISIAVPPGLTSGLRQRVDDLRPLLQGFEGQFTVEEDAALGEQGCRVEWKNGYAERNVITLWSDIEALINKTTLNLKEPN